MDQPQITPGANGYQAMLPETNHGTNPWQITDTSAQVSQGMQNLQNSQTQMQAYAGNSGQYPTFQNSMGIGSQNAFGATAPAPVAAVPQNAPTPPAPAMPDSGSRGFNPWSLSGEALSR